VSGVPARCWVLRDRTFCPFGGGVVATLWASAAGRLVVWWGYRPYFENYTVDASIFKMTFRGCLV